MDDVALPAVRELDRTIPRPRIGGQSRESGDGRNDAPDIYTQAAERERAEHLLDLRVEGVRRLHIRAVAEGLVEDVAEHELGGEQHVEGDGHCASNVSGAVRDGRSRGDAPVWKMMPPSMVSPPGFALFSWFTAAAALAPPSACMTSATMSWRSQVSAKGSVVIAQLTELTKTMVSDGGMLDAYARKDENCTNTIAR